MQHLSLSASQEISLLTRSHRLKKLILSLGFQQPLHILTYNCKPDLTPIGLAMLGYEVRAVNSDPMNTQQIKQSLQKWDNVISCDSYPIDKLGVQERQLFDVIIIDGAVMTELHLDSQLEDVCQQLATTIRPDGLLVITKADFDETLQTKEQVLRPHLRDDNSGRHLEIIVRDWHGNGYEYTETHYRITHGDGDPTVSYQAHQRRAWRNAELALALTQAGFQDMLWQSCEEYDRLLTAKKAARIV